MSMKPESGLFSQMPKGLGAVNIGTDDWSAAKQKQERINSYISSIDGKDFKIGQQNPLSSDMNIIE